jgi:hypothetical protein
MTGTREERAALLGFTLERGPGGYRLTNGDGVVVLDDDVVAKKSKAKKAKPKKVDAKMVDSFVIRHIRTMAAAIGHRLTSQRHTEAQSLYELAPGEVRAKQAATFAYKLERKVVIVDQARREDLVGNTAHNRKQRDARAIGEGRKVGWVTVLGDDCSASLDEVIDYLISFQTDHGIDVDDVEADDEKRKKVRPPSVQKMHADLADHTNADKIKEIGVGNQKIDRRPKREDIRRQDAINHILGTLGGPGAERIPSGELQRLLRELRQLQKKDTEAKRKKGNYDAEKDDPVRRGLIAATHEVVRRRILFREKDKILFKPAIGAEAPFDTEWVERDPNAPDWRWVSGQRVEVISYRDACRRHDTKMPAGGLDGVRLDKAKALIDEGNFADAGRLLIKVKQAGKGHRGAFGQSLKAAGIHPRTASRCMAAANSDSK